MEGRKVTLIKMRVKQEILKPKNSNQCMSLIESLIISPDFMIFIHYLHIKFCIRQIHYALKSFEITTSTVNTISLISGIATAFK